MGNKWGKPYYYACLLPWESSSLPSMEKVSRRSLVDFISCRDGTENQRRPTWLEFARQDTKEERATQKKKVWKCAEAPLDIQWSIVWHMYVWRNYQRPRKKLFEWLWELILGIHKGLGTVPIISRQTGTPHNSQGIEQHSQKGLASVVGHNWL